MNGTCEFGDFELNVADRCLTNRGRPVRLSPKALDVLIVLVENRGKIVERGDLMRQVWPDTFVEDNSLAFNVSVLRKVFGESGASPRYIETVPKRGYRFIAPLRDVPGESAPFPIPASRNIEPIPPVSGLSRYRLPLLVVLVAAIALLAGRWLIVPSSAPRSLAVLPFRALDRASADDSLELGLTDALITRLNRSLMIPVRPMSAVVRYRERQEDPLVAARALAVDAVLEGTFQKRDGRIRSSVRLLRTRDGKVIYSDIFDDDISALFRLEDALSTKLASALTLNLAPIGERRTTHNPAAYAAYLKGRTYWNQRTRESIHQSLSLFHEAIRADPGDALAYAGLADAYLLLPAAERTPNGDLMLLAKAAAQRAIQLDPGLAEAHASLGLLALNYDRDWNAAERELVTAIRLDPNYSTARHWYAEYLGSMGRLDESHAEFARARSLDPLSAAIPADEAKIFWYAHQYDKTAAFARQSISLDPHFALGHLMLATGLAALGMCSEAVEEVRPPRVVDDSDTTLVMQVLVEEQCGAHANAMAALRRLTGDGRDTGTPFMVAGAYAALGENDRAQQWLERTVAEHGFGLVSLRSNPEFDRMRSDERFQKLLADIRLRQP